MWVSTVVDFLNEISLHEFWERVYYHMMRITVLYLSIFARSNTYILTQSIDSRRRKIHLNQQVFLHFFNNVNIPFSWKL